MGGSLEGSNEGSKVLPGHVGVWILFFFLKQSSRLTVVCHEVKESRYAIHQERFHAMAPLHTIFAL